MISLLLPCAEQDLSELIRYKNKIIERQGFYDSAFLSIYWGAGMWAKTRVNMPISALCQNCTYLPGTETLLCASEDNAGPLSLQKPAFTAILHLVGENSSLNAE